MVKHGISSVSFRNAKAEDVISAAAAAGLAGIEWSADTHAPHGDGARAEELMMATLRARLTVSAYGSFYRLISEAGDSARLSFEPVLESARRLQAPCIRIWSGRPTANGGNSAFRTLVDAAKAIADNAGKLGITVCMEPLGRSIVDSYTALAELMSAVDHPFFKACWTQLPGTEEDAPSAPELSEWVHLIHARNWTESYSRRSLEENPLSVGKIVSAMAERANKTNLDLWALIEYLQDEESETLAREASALNALIDRYTVATATTPSAVPLKGASSKSS